MMKEDLKHILEDVKSGVKSVFEAIEELRYLHYEDIKDARVDHHRSLRTGIPEAIFCEGKSMDQVMSIARNILERGGNLLATRVSNGLFDALKTIDRRMVYHPIARMVTLIQRPNPETKGLIMIITAGTSDIPIAEEAKTTCNALGSRVETLYDVGVAGIHRLLEEGRRLFNARVICVVAGMEGALASIVGGITDRPIIAVPTSIGYGANLQGLSALLTMINSCSPGIAVVNIDNGFGAGCIAHKINIIGEAKDQDKK
ncbi:nickel pincer cofactor biosynthesis protein LarB [bacterium]|nr:nickel pincer cofactor biosynthesis protein LarB [bacterium]